MFLFKRTKKFIDCKTEVDSLGLRLELYFYKVSLFNISSFFFTVIGRMRWLGGWAWRLGGAMGVMWLVGVALLTPSPPPSSTSQDTRLAQRLQRAVHELDSLKKQNDDIRNVLHDFTK